MKKKKKRKAHDNHSTNDGHELKQDDNLVSLFLYYFYTF